MWPSKNQFGKNPKSTLNGSSEALAALGRASASNRPVTMGSFDKGFGYWTGTEYVQDPKLDGGWGGPKLDKQGNKIKDTGASGNYVSTGPDGKTFVNNVRKIKGGSKSGMSITPNIGGGILRTPVAPDLGNQVNK